MNILPKKSWHVRNKDNIERVRRDEEKAAEEEKARQHRIAIAESEARTELLRQKSRQRQTSDAVAEEIQASSTTPSKHINFFEDFEQGKKLGGKNAEHEEEKRQERERQEKAIGLLTYLGQGSVELSAEKPWYFKVPEKRKRDDDDDTKAKKAKDEVDAKKKRLSDPMCTMNTYVDQSIKVRKLKHGSSDQDDIHQKHGHRRHKSEGEKSTTKTVDQLRAERVRREQQERQRTEQLLAKLRGDKPAAAAAPIEDDRQRRYNSQFNPDFARRPRPYDS